MFFAVVHRRDTGERQHVGPFASWDAVNFWRNEMVSQKRLPSLTVVTIEGPLIDPHAYDYFKK